MPEHTPLVEAIRSATDPVSVFERVTQQCLELLPNADGAAIEMRRDVDHLEYVTAAGTLARSVGIRVPINNSLSGLALRTGAIQRTDDAPHDSRVNLKAVNATQVVSMLCVPFGGDGSANAVLKVSSQQAAAFTLEDARILMQLADFVSTAVRAASQLAEVSRTVMAEAAFSDRSTAGETERSMRMARFVANVMRPGLVERLDLTNTFAAIIADDAVEVVLQPVVALDGGRVRGFEALARFPNTEYGPDWWFASAYAVGLGVELELHVAAKALALLDRIPAEYRMSLNLGPHAAMDERLTGLFAGRDLRRLTLELTEHDAVEDYERMLTNLQQLRDQGLALSVDDAGSGYSGLSHIRRLLPDVIKVDRDLTTQIDADPVRQALARALTEFARHIDALVIAEGIERQEEADAVHAIGIAYGQGYLLGRPAPIEHWFPAV